MRVLQPPGWSTPHGYVNGVAANGTLVFVAGQIGWNARCEFDSDDFVEQVRHALQNMKSRLPGHGGVANPRDTNGYRCGLRLALTRNPSISFCARTCGTPH